MEVRGAQLLAGAASGIFAALGVGLGIWVVVEGYSPVPFADFWGQIPLLERAVGGDLRMADFWAQSNEHRILVPRVQFVLDYRFFDGTYVFLYVAIAATCLLLAGLFAAVVWLETGDRLLTWGTLCASAIATMSPAADENLTWAFQVQFVQVFFFAALAIAGVALAARSGSPTGRSLWLVATAIAAIAATYSMANGLLAWPLVVLLALALRLGWRAVAALGSVAAVTIASYLWHLDFGTGGSLSDPLGLIAYTAVYLGSAFGGAGEVAAGVLGGAGVGLLALLCVLGWRRRTGGSIAIAFGVGVALFVLLTALQTAFGRLDLGISQALSPRYAFSSFTFWLALVVGFLPPLSERLGHAAQITAPAYLAGVAAVALVVGVTALPSGAELRSDVMGKETAVLAHRAGVDDPSGTLTGGAPGSVVAESFRWMEENELGPWAPGGMVNDMTFTISPALVTSLRCVGAIEFVEPVGGGLRLTGWITPVVIFEPLRNLAVLDRRGVPRGIGRVGTHRPDVASLSDWNGFVAYARGDPDRPLAVVLVGDDRRTGACRLETR